ncbi:hypothetical protein Ahy_B01g055449 [Arachis hypogaea]|uniref:Uncharacterized protein n=1 Tax=Arachis hypogaea TaxID=3818 RepID=A0A445AWF1_ARAHY|nr:hypothetical protein Ahy_B01g055449 [Arachis hypogaea]
MEERRRGCFVATEAPPPLLGLVAIAVLPSSDCCAAAEEVEGMSRRRRALSPSRCLAAHHHRRILCHQFKGGYGFDSNDELQRLIKIEKYCLLSCGTGRKWSFIYVFLDGEWKERVFQGRTGIYVQSSKAFEIFVVSFMIRICLSQLYAEDITTPDDKQELDEVLQQEVDVRKDLIRNFANTIDLDQLDI